VTRGPLTVPETFASMPKCPRASSSTRLVAAIRSGGWLVGPVDWRSRLADGGR
jgi:hypothetical protein